MKLGDEILLETASTFKATKCQRKNKKSRIITQANPRNPYFNKSERTLYLHANTTKTEKERYVYLTDEALAVIEAVPARTDGRLFAAAPDTLGNWLYHRCKANGIEDLVFHDCRHEALSRFGEMGWPIERISASSGHEEWGTLKRYLHPSRHLVKRDSMEN